MSSSPLRCPAACSICDIWFVMSCSFTVSCSLTEDNCTFNSPTSRSCWNLRSSSCFTCSRNMSTSCLASLNRDSEASRRSWQFVAEEVSVCCWCCSSSMECSATFARLRASSSWCRRLSSNFLRSSAIERCSSATALACSCLNSANSRWCLASSERSRCWRSSATTCARVSSSLACLRAASKDSSLSCSRSMSSEHSARHTRSLPARCCFTTSSVPQRIRKARCVSSRN
mmetsp:Transcript_10649/g.25041  ORF Transcript_10649/g.25041 Transcript_10649/m.25041 type:complete len:229 (-) Transcript_10649:430-1116(-)